jgi:hypothetical protein
MMLSSFQRLQATIEEKKYALDFSILARQEIQEFARNKYDYLTKRDLELAADLLY